MFVDTVNEGEAAAQLAATLDEMYGAELFFIGVAPVGQSAQIRRAVVYCGRRIQRTVQHTVNQWMQNGAKETFCAKLSLHVWCQGDEENLALELALALQHVIHVWCTFRPTTFSSVQFGRVALRLHVPADGEEDILQRRGAVSNEGEVEALLQLRTVQIPGELNGAAGIYQIKTPCALRGGQHLLHGFGVLWTKNWV